MMFLVRRHNTNHKMGLLMLACCLMLAAPGCQRFWGKGATAETGEVKTDLELKIGLDKSEYQPGEAVRVEVELVNHTGKPQLVRDLGAQSLQFYYGRKGGLERMERRPVVSTQEGKDQAVELKPGEPLRRAFLLTRLTQFRGPMTAQVHYATGAADKAGLPSKVYSHAAGFEVKGQQVFERDPEGLIKKEDAVNVALGRAETAAPGAVLKESDAVLIEDEAGFYQWWVNLTLAGPDGAPLTVSYFVNPYLGQVRHQARAPFDPALARDRRLARPANMPEQPVSINNLINQGPPKGNTGATPAAGGGK